MQALRVLWLLPFLLLAGCLNDKPGEGDMRAQIDARLTQQTLGMVKLVRMEKLNGFKPDDRRYQAKVHLVMEVVKTPDQVAEELKDEPLSPLERMAAMLAIGALKFGAGDIKVGDVLEKTTVYQFIHTEAGWRLEKEVEDSQL